MENNLYIIKTYGKFNQCLIKLGYSNNVNKRLQNYLTHNPFIEIIGTYFREDAWEFERNYHKSNFSKFRNEWYEEHYLEDMLDQIKNGIIEYKIISRLVRKRIDNNNISNIEITDKKCCICKENKIVDEFNNCKTNKDGLHHQCKLCKKKYRIKVKDKIKEYNYIYNINKKE